MRETHYVCTIQRVRIYVLRNTIDRFKPETLKLTLDVKPPGEQHPFCAVDDIIQMRQHKDPGLRLGICLSGTYRTNRPDDAEYEDQGWINLEGNDAIFQANRLVAWIDGEKLDAKVPRPRIWYP